MYIALEFLKGTELSDPILQISTMALRRLTSLLLLITQVQTQESPGLPEPPAHVAIDIDPTDPAPYSAGAISVENPDGDVCVAFPDYVGQVISFFHHFWSLL